MAKSVMLWSTHCPRCKVLELKLQQKGVRYEVNNGISEKEKVVEVMTAKGFTEAPKLEVDGVVMGFKDAVDWVKEQ